MSNYHKTLQNTSGKKTKMNREHIKFMVAFLLGIAGLIIGLFALASQL